jgi:hypothetical protein
MRTAWTIVLLLLAFTSAGCEIVGDIFQAGFWVGTIVVLIVIAGIAMIASRLRR